MPVRFENIKFITSFIRNTDKEMRDSRKYAEIFARELESIVLHRVDSSIFLGGILQNQQYSRRPIKAYKLGQARVEGKGMDKVLEINGIQIAQEDWYWGAWDMQKKGLTPSSFGGGMNFGDYTAKPVPVFIPGYREWRVRYNNKSPEVNLSFTGNMLDNFEVDIISRQGHNQFGGKYSFEFIVDRPQHEIGEYTDFYRNWLSVTEDEIDEAMEQVVGQLTSVIMSGGA